MVMAAMEHRCRPSCNLRLAAAVISGGAVWTAHTGGTDAIMLKGLDPLLNADLLYVLAAMGHGDELALVDRNFPAVSLGARLIRLEGVDAPRALEAILSVMPLDDMLDTPYTRMVDLGSAEVEESEVCREFIRIVERHEGPRWQIGRLDRFGFYDRARAAFAVVVTGEMRVNGSLLLTKGIVRPADPIQAPPPEAAQGEAAQGESAGAEPETASPA
jgi:L-fucose mutarotase